MLRRLPVTRDVRMIQNMAMVVDNGRHAFERTFPMIIVHDGEMRDLIAHSSG